ncbi:hypothetical protein GCM10018952_30480 [Streptosporangium vulgare]
MAVRGDATPPATPPANPPATPRRNETPAPGTPRNEIPVAEALRNETRPPVPLRDESRGVASAREESRPGAHPSRCEVCGDPIRAARTGRPARFCGAACRQKAHRRRSRAALETSG